MVVHDARPRGKHRWIRTVNLTLSNVSAWNEIELLLQNTNRYVGEDSTNVVLGCRVANGLLMASSELTPG